MYSSAREAFLAFIVPVALLCAPALPGSTANLTTGQSMTLSVTSDGTAPLTYQWYKDGAAVAGATSGTYAVSAVQLTSAGQYTVMVANAAGSVCSDVAAVTVQAPSTPPVIVSGPLSQAVISGSGISLTVAVTGNPTPSLQWFKNGVAIAGANGATLAIPAVVAADAGSYLVVATNSAGTASSAAATLSVIVPPVFTTQPVAKTVKSGQSVTFAAAASGTPAPTYQWCKNGVPIVGATASSYTLASTSYLSVGTYTVVASNLGGAVTSAGAYLTVNEAPRITSQPVGQTVAAGSSVTFTVVANGKPAPTYQWRKNGVSIAGATSASYTIPSVKAADAGTYTVFLANIAGSGVSSGAVLVVNSTPVFTTQPASQTALTGGTVTFTALAIGSPAPTYQWRKNGVAISGATAASYSIASLTAANAGTYSVVATNSGGAATSANATLTVNSLPSITSQPAGVTVTKGASATLSVVATGSPSPSYQWSKNAVPIVGATSSSYTIAAAASTDAGTYAVTVTNTAGSVTSSDAVVTVQFAPQITQQPASLQASTGTAASFAVVATGAPTPSYQWCKNGAPIAGATAATYSIASVTDTSAGSYTVIVSNVVGAITSNAAALTVTEGPVITQQPVSLTVTLGHAATFSVAATGLPAPTYQWRRNGSLLAGENSAAFTLASAQFTDEASYDVVVTNTQGSVASAAAALVVTPPLVPPAIGADFNHDGWPDLLWLNARTNACTVWLMQGATRLATVSLGTATADWDIAGTGDFNGDGATDVLWRNQVTGGNLVWLMNGTTVQSTASIQSLTGTSVVAAVGDFDNDGFADIVWNNPQTGAHTLWLMHGTALSQTLPLTLPGTAKTVRGTGDFNGDGQTDLLAVDSQGNCHLQLMNGLTPQTDVLLAAGAPGVELVGAGDFDGDGRSDVLWFNGTTPEVWYIKALAVSSKATLPVAAASDSLRY